MKLLLFSARPHDRDSFDDANRGHRHAIIYLDARLADETAALAAGFPAVCPFVNDRLGDSVVAALARGGTRLIALAGFSHVDLEAARDHGLTVIRVPAYSPYAVAEHTQPQDPPRVRPGPRGQPRARGPAGIRPPWQDGRCRRHRPHRRRRVRILLGLGCRVLVSDPMPSGECLRHGGLDVGTLAS